MTIEAVVYAYKRPETNGQLTKVDFAACEKIGPRQFRDIEHLRESLEMVEQLSDETLYMYDFSGQDMRGVNLANLTLNGCKFRDCNLEGAQFGGADLLGVEFTGSNLRNASLRNVSAPHKEYVVRNYAKTMAQLQLFYDRYDFGPAVFDGADMTGADLLHARLHGAKFDCTELHDARMDHADLSGARFTNTHFGNARMHMTDINEASFANAPLSKTQLGHVVGNAIGHSRNEASRLRRMNRPTP